MKRIALEIEDRKEELEKEFFDRFLLPLHLAERKYREIAKHDGLSMDELVDLIYEEEYESYLTGGLN